MFIVYIERDIDKKSIDILKWNSKNIQVIQNKVVKEEWRETRQKGKAKFK